MRILVTGGSGFVGRALTKRLILGGHEVVAGSRRGESVEGARGVKLDVTSFGSVGRAFGEVEPQAVAHLVGIIAPSKGQTFEDVHVLGTRHVLAASPPHTRFLHMSALGARENSDSAYFVTKARAERLVQGSNLPFTIFRPSLIFGKGDDFFGRVLRELVSAAPFVPVIGDGSFPLRPVSVSDVTFAFSQALNLPESVGQTYELVGPTEYRFDDLLRLELSALGLSSKGRGKPLIRVPLALMNLAVPIMQILPNPPITKDQYAMLTEGNTGDPTRAQRTFDLPLRRLEDELPDIVQAARTESQRPHSSSSFR